MIDDMLAGLFGEVLLGRLSASRRARLLFRLFFGILGAALGAAGAVHFSGRSDLTENGPLRFAVIALFVFLASFSLFNVALGRKWRWPGVMFVVSFVALFVARVVLGP